MDARLKAGGGLTEKERARFSGIDERLQRLDKQLREGSLDVGTRGANRVAAMAGYIANVLDAQTGIREKRPPPPPPVVLFRNDSADGTQVRLSAPSFNGRMRYSTVLGMRLRLVRLAPSRRNLSGNN